MPPILCRSVNCLSVVYVGPGFSRPGAGRGRIGAPAEVLSQTFRYDSSESSSASFHGVWCAGAIVPVITER